MHKRTIANKIIEYIINADTTIRGHRFEVEEWERIRTTWAELGICLAAAKPVDVENADQYTTLEEVHIDNFNDAMKVLK